VRARVRQDLVNLIELADLDVEIQQWERADYRVRIIVDLEDFLEIMVQLAADLDYDNFKARVCERETQSGKLSAYHRIWATMAELQNE
jgi:hypothetical protein